MSRFVDVLYSYLSAYSGLTALVGTNIYPLRVSQDSGVPFVEMEQVSREKIYSHSGFCGSNIYSYQFSAYAATKDAAELIAQQIANAMEAWRATNSSIGYALQQGEADAYEVGPNRYCVDCDFNIYYNE